MGSRRSTPEIAAPQAGDIGVTVIDMMGTPLRS
jgi:hypothetical protein